MSPATGEVIRGRCERISRLPDELACSALCLLRVPRRRHDRQISSLWLVSPSCTSSLRQQPSQALWCTLPSARPMPVQLPSRREAARRPVARLSTSVRCAAFWSLRGGHPASRGRVLQRHCSGTVPSILTVGSMRKFGCAHARRHVLVALVITSGPNCVSAPRRRHVGEVSAIALHAA